MENSQIKRNLKRYKRALRTRKHVRGSSEKPRLCVIKTSNHIHAQLIDDDAGTTLASVSTLSKDFRNTEFNRKNKNSGRELGLKIASLAMEKNVKKIVFDRGSHKYHGVIAALADAAREAGLEF